MKTKATKWLLVFVCSGIVLAQSTGGSGIVSGTVRDENGAGLPDTTVTIDNPSLAFQREVDTTDEGVFEAPGIVSAPGYKLKIERKGFRGWVSAEFAVPVGQPINFDIRLEAGTGTEQTSGGAVSATESNRGDISTAFDAQQLEALPLVPRRLDSLTLLAPAVNTDATGGLIAALGFPLENAFMTDGILTGEGYFAQRPQNDATPLNAIQGFEVLTADPPLEFGHSMNGIVNSATRSGTNGYHGSAYGYLRLPSLTADGRYTDGHTLLHGRDQAGADVGGPILHGKLFFFANYEVVNDRYDGLNRITSQLIADPSASIVAPSNCKATAAECAAADKFIQSQMNVLVPLSQRSVDGFARIDYRLTRRHSLNVSGNLMNALAPDWNQVSSAATNGGLIGIKNTRDDSRYITGGVSSALFSSTTNELRLGYSEDQIFDPTSIGNLSTGGVGISVAGATIGDPNPNSSLVTEHRRQVLDNFTLPWGSHTFQLGVDASTTSFFVNSLASEPEYDFASLTAFATDLASTTAKDYTLFTQGIGLPGRHFPLGELDVYGQDTWRASSKTTVTLGLRWEKPLTPQPAQENSTYYQTGTIGSSNLGLMPRLGIAYRVNDKTAVRLGYGFYYAPFSGQLMDALYQGNAQSQATLAMGPGVVGAPAFPTAIYASSTRASGSVVSSLPVCNYGICTVNTTSTSGAIPAGAEEVEFAAGKLRIPHTQQASLEVERRLDSRTTLTASVIDSRAFRLLTASESNLTAPSQSITYILENANGDKTGTFNLPVYTSLSDTTYSHIFQVGNGGLVRYDALAVDVHRQMARGLMLQGSYTWSHAFDNLNGPMIAGGIPLIEANAGFTSNRASSALDQRHRLVVNGVWQPTPVSSKSFLARYLINGWQLSTILTMASGHPVTANVSTDELVVNGVTPLFPGTMDGSGGTTRLPFLPLDTYHTGAEYNLDARLARSIPFTERIRGLLTFDVFNALNSQWTTSLNTIAYTASAGIVRAVPGAGTGAAAVSYPYGTNARSAQASFRIVF